MNSIVLKFLDIFRMPFTWLGVNFDQLRAIVHIKLIMDNRRQIMSYRKKENQEPANTFLYTLFFYTLFGGFIAMGLFNIPSFILSMMLFFSYIMVMVSMTLITDFSSILLDTSDNTIILPRPVSSRTLFVSRLIHIFLYLGQITLGLTIIPAFVVLIKYGITTLFLFLLATILSVMTGVFITNALYLLILQFANEEKLKNVINYFQIVMAIVIMGGYQVLPRLAGRFDLEDYVFEIEWWSYLAPPVWMAAGLEAAHYRFIDTPHFILALLAITIPLAGIFLVNKYLTPVFGRKLGIIGTDNSKPKEKKEGRTFVSQISRWVSANVLERGAFELVYNILARDRKIKLKIYPSFGYVIIFGLIFLLRDRQNLEDTLRGLPDTQYHLVLLYMTFMILQIAFYEVPYSDDFKASWIYSSAPLNSPGQVLTGTLKAIVVRLFIPGYVILSTIVLLIWGLSAADDVVFGFFNNLLMLLIIVLLNKKSLPFSIAPTARNQSGNLIRSLIMVVLIVSVGFSHSVLSHYPILLLSSIPVQLAILYILYNYYSKTSWEQITL